MNLWAVIPSCCRPVELSNLINQLHDDGVQVVVVDTGYTATDLAEVTAHVDRKGTWLRDSGVDANVSRWWNIGLNHVAAAESKSRDYYIAMLNDDVILPERFTSRLAAAIIEHDVDIAYPDQSGSGTQRYDWHNAPGIYRRMSGYAFVLRGSAGIFGDETIKWWYGDDDVEWKARKGRGTVCIGGMSVQHLYPSSTTFGVRAEQAERDRVTFLNKWGALP